MIISFSKLMRMRVMSLQMGGAVAVIERAIVEPETLKIIAFVLSGPGLGNADTGRILDARSVREVSSVGIIIDSVDELVNSGDVVRIDEVEKLKFDLIGMRVVTRKKAKLGKIIDFDLTSDNLELVQMTVSRPPLKAIMDPELVIAREEIVEVTDDEIIVKDEEKTLREKAAKNPNFVPNFVNPFREPDFAKAQTKNPGE